MTSSPHPERTELPARPGRPFFDLQYTFAAAVARVTGIPMADALLGYTSLYLRFGFPRPIDGTDSGWQNYLHGVRHAGDPLAWTWRFAQAHTRSLAGEHFGCFTYHLPDPGVVQLHFEHRDTSGVSPLNRSRLPLRTEELCAMFQAIARRHPKATTVRGGSWLYNLPPYASLFPPIYLRSARPVLQFQAADRWGQFLDRHGQVRPSFVTEFLICVERQASFEELIMCFPYPVLAPECEIEYFYAFFGVSDTRQASP